MHATRVAILGASGYAGLELLTLLAGHPDVEVVVAGSDRYAGQTVESLVGVVGAVGRLSFVSTAQTAAIAATCDVVIFATPAEASLAQAPAYVAAGKRVIDLSGAFRFADGDVFRAAYNLEPVAHAAIYGLPELNRDAIAKARLVANPGCYPTAAALALGPLLAAGAIEPEVIVDAMSGVTGAGRKTEEAYSLAELDANACAYKVLRHQHQPEIAQTLASYARRAVDGRALEEGGGPASVAGRGDVVRRDAPWGEAIGDAVRTMADGDVATASAPASDPPAAGGPYRTPGLPPRDARAVDVTFTPHLVPIRRGILATCYARAVRPTSATELTQLYRRTYRNERFVRVADSPDEVSLARVVGTNECLLGVAADGTRVVVTSAIDNLVKGAAGQAIQNLNLMLGLEESTGLAHLRRLR